HHQDSAFYPSIAQLERAAGFRREDTSEQRLAKLEVLLSQGTNDLSEVVPLLADLLSISTVDRYPPLNLTPQKRKEKTLHAQLAWNSTHSESPDSEAPKGFIRLNNLAPIVTSYSVSKPQFTCVSSSVLSMHNLTD